MRSIIIIFCLLAEAVFAKAQQSYDVSLIQKELLPYAARLYGTRK
ncbi:MAG TPA: hypothetical protein VIM16_06590 [Mucilaginibacter sp.]|jgi:hypothetical protein